MNTNIGFKQENPQSPAAIAAQAIHGHRSLLVEIRNITKQYPGSNKKANNNISLEINKGEILCIAGENGAGKTTLMKILAGLENPDSGEIVFKEKTGIGMVHQHFMLFPEYTAAQNIVMGKEPRKRGIFFDNKKANEYSQKIIDNNNFSIKSTQKVKELTLGQMQQVEICRVLYHNADLIILDEPTAILTEEETQSLFKTIRQLVKDGKTIIFITHKMKEIEEISDRVVVLQEGEVREEGKGNREKGKGNSEHGIVNNEQGTGNREQGICSNTNLEIQSNYSKQKTLLPPPSSLLFSPHSLLPILEFENVTVRRKGQNLPLLDNVSFAVSAGEILGFTGTGGNGLGVIEAVLGGFLHPAQGRVLHKGRDISHFSIRRLRNNGLAFVPADRKRYGSCAGASIEENLIINCRDNFYKYGFLNKKEMRRFSQKLIQDYNIQCEIDKTASSLSGGNLQKLILAREINNITDYIVFSEPTWGLDTTAAAFIKNEILRLRDKGAAVILISTNAEEAYELADRVIVMNKGRGE